MSEDQGKTWIGVDLGKEIDTQIFHERTVVYGNQNNQEINIKPGAFIKVNPAAAPVFFSTEMGKVVTSEEFRAQVRKETIKEVAEEYHLEMAKVFDNALKQTVLLDERQKLKEAVQRHKNYAQQILNEEWLKDATSK